MSVFLDVNIVMYAAGEPHAHKEPSLRLLREAAEGRHELVSDAEALQELLYRYWRLRQVDRGAALVQQMLRLVPTILPVEKRDVALASTLLTQHQQLEPRDAIHAAVMLNHGLTQLYSYDHHFDAIPSLSRLEP